jgi:DNA-binding IscR family transcriptional regulator
MDNKEQIVLEAIDKAGKPVKSGDIATMTGLDKNDVSKIISKLKKDGKVTSPKRCFYAPAN